MLRDKSNSVRLVSCVKCEGSCVIEHSEASSVVSARQRHRPSGSCVSVLWETSRYVSCVWDLCVCAVASVCCQRDQICELCVRCVSVCDVCVCAFSPTRVLLNYQERHKDIWADFLKSISVPMFSLIFLSFPITRKWPNYLPIKIIYCTFLEHFFQKHRASHISLLLTIRLAFYQKNFPMLQG